MQKRRDAFFGREAELQELEELWRKPGASLVVCRGRRRIGKSTLVERFAQRGSCRFLKFEGKMPEPGQRNQDQLDEFCRALSAQTSLPRATVADWGSAFALLDKALGGNRKTVVLLDEISWMGRHDPGFPGDLKIAWDNLWRKHPRLVLVLCGSVSAWIAENILANTGFVGRISRDIVLKELPLRDCLAFWGARAKRTATRDIVDVLSVTGGVPKYLEEIDPSLPADENIKRLCFRPSGPLVREFRQIFHDVFGVNASAKREILRALADGAKSASEIAAATGTERGGHVGRNLEELELAGFVARDSGLNPATGSRARQDRYRLSDNYTRFFLRFIEPRLPEIEGGRYAFASLPSLPGWETVLGLQFENLVLGHVAELLPFLRLEGVPILSAAPFRTKGGRRGEGVQIDLLLQTRKAVFVVEAKRRGEIGEEVEEEVARKVERLPVPRGKSVRTALVYEGHLAPVVEGNAWFDALVPFDLLLGRPPRSPA
jgi:hypothetical protein